MNEKKESGIPPFLNPQICNSVAKLREEKTNEETKFANLKRQNSFKFIEPSLNEEYEGKSSHKTFRKRLNKQLKEKAILLLRRRSFVKGILEIAQKSALFNIRYKMRPFDFYEYQSSPSVNAWECRLTYLSVMQKRKFPNKETVDALEVFRKRVFEFLQKQGLESYWEESITHLLITGIWYLPRHTSIIHVKLYDRYEKEYPNPCISIEISRDTRSDEIKFRWHEIERIKQDFYNKIKSRNKVSKHDIEELIDCQTDLYKNSDKKSIRALNRAKTKSEIIEKDLKRFSPLASEMIENLKRPLESITYF